MTLEAALFTPLVVLCTVGILWGMVNLAVIVAEWIIPDQSDRPADDWKGEGTPRW